MTPWKVALKLKRNALLHGRIRSHDHHFLGCILYYKNWNYFLSFIVFFV